MNEAIANEIVVTTSTLTKWFKVLRGRRETQFLYDRNMLFIREILIASCEYLLVRERRVGAGHCTGTGSATTSALTVTHSESGRNRDLIVLVVVKSRRD